MSSDSPDNSSIDLNADFSALGFTPEHLVKLARWQMPFGKYSGTELINLPEEYLFWFQKKGFPNGELGELMKFCLDLKIEGLDSLIRPLVKQHQQTQSKPVNYLDQKVDPNRAED